MQDAIRGDKNLLHKANWEHKTNNVIQKNLVIIYQYYIDINMFCLGPFQNYRHEEKARIKP